MYEGTYGGRVAVIVGGGSGIGRATGNLMAERGAKVVVVDVNGEAAERVAEEIRSAGGEAIAIVCDVSDEDQVIEMFAATDRAHGRLDVLCNYAAILDAEFLSRDRDVVTANADDWDRAMAVNARGQLFTCKHGVPLMVKSGGGSIINASSGSANSTGARMTTYSMTKAAVESLTRYVAGQFARDGVRCNAIHPWAIGERHATRPDRDQLGSTDRSVFGRVGTPMDVARVVAFLGSPEATWLTGAIIPADGGIHLRP
jgi:NAD(P)-dependent dehydrogenase (short-subunit alcohol dehydrogenase family)